VPNLRVFPVATENDIAMSRVDAADSLANLRRAVAEVES
jgi:hypothetical protein